jgi:hypothetical protein
MVVLVVILIALLVFVPGGESHHRHAFKVPYGEEMTAHDFTEIHLGEEDATVLERLAESGRPERLVEPYVLVLFPLREEGTYCTYFEFSDEPEIFARLCFSESSGELVQKLKHDVRRPLRSQVPQGQSV